MPILYLPGVSRATLRATEECPNELKPLAELQYRGVFWSQANGKDWTVTAFLQTEQGGLQLKIAKDQATATAIRRAIEKLMDVPVADLQAKSASGELNSNYFDLLISDDPVDDLLTWLADPKGARKRWESRPLGSPVQPIAERLRLRPRPRRRSWSAPRISACKRSRPGRRPGSGSPPRRAAMPGWWSCFAGPSRSPRRANALRARRGVLAAGQRGRGSRVAADRSCDVGRARSASDGAHDAARTGEERTSIAGSGSGQS